MTVISTRDEKSARTEAEASASDLTEAADRAGAIVSEQIRAMLEAAEKRANEIRRSAEKDARVVRQGAANEAGTLFAKLEALEAPLDALVSSLRGELDSLSTEFRRHWANNDIVMHAVPDNGDGSTARHEEPQAQDHSSSETVQHQAVQPEPEPEQPQSVETKQHEAVQPEPEPEEADTEVAEAEPYEEPEAEPEPAADEQEWTEAEAIEEVAEEPHAHEEHAAPKKRKRGWFKRRKDALFVTTPGQCAVCYRSYAAGTEEALAESGWKVSGELGLCPTCQNDGWQLPEGARLPYRRAAG